MSGLALARALLAALVVDVLLVAAGIALAGCDVAVTHDSLPNCAKACADGGGRMKEYAPAYGIDGEHVLGAPVIIQHRAASCVCEYPEVKP